MKKRLLGIGLGLLTVALFIGPIAYAFYSNGWSVKDTVVPSDEQISSIQNKIQGTLGGGTFEMGDFELVENVITEDKITLVFSLSSPPKFSIENMWLTLFYGQDKENLADLSLEKVEGKRITLSGQTTDTGKNIIKNSTDKQVLAKLQTGGMSFEFEASGITLIVKRGSGVR